MLLNIHPKLKRWIKSVQKGNKPYNPQEFVKLQNSLYNNKYIQNCDSPNILFKEKINFLKNENFQPFYEDKTSEILNSEYNSNYIYYEIPYNNEKSHEIIPENNFYFKDNDNKFYLNNGIYDQEILEPSYSSYSEKKNSIALYHESQNNYSQSHYSFDDSKTHINDKSLDYFNGNSHNSNLNYQTNLTNSTCKNIMWDSKNQEAIQNDFVEPYHYQYDNYNLNNYDDEQIYYINENLNNNKDVYYLDTINYPNSMKEYQKESYESYYYPYSTNSEFIDYSNYSNQNFINDFDKISINNSKIHIAPLNIHNKSNS